MRFSATLALPLLLSSVTGFVIPQGQADGVYSVHMDEAGNEVHTLLSGPEVSAREINPLVARATRTWCGCGIVLNNGDTDAANADLRNKLGRGTNIGARGAMYSVRGSAAAFACNLSGASKLFSGDALPQNNAQITNACGRYTAGTYGELGNYVTGYMRSSENGGNFCGAATGAGASRC